MTGDFTQTHQKTSRQTKEKDQLSLSLNVLLNYWEIKPSLYEAKLSELALKDIQIVSAFVPWSHLETDIHHCLKKFVKAVFASKLNLRLFVMPELGVHYPNCGFPKDLLSNHTNLASDRQGKVIYNAAAPNIFPLPSFSSPEVLKRFGNYLIKLGTVLAEVFAEVGSSDFCEVVVTNSLFNYYRNLGLSLGDHGDYAAAHVMAFRDFLDREYKVSTAASVVNEQFKMQLYEGFNRHRFFTHVEKLLREKIDMVFARKNTACTVRHLDLFNPECDPAVSYHNLISEVFNYKPSIARFYETIVSGGYRMETIFLGNPGVFRRFSDQEKSFLILAALIHAGEVSVESADLFELSAAFQRKLRSMVMFLDEKKFKRRTSVVYYSASKFSMEESSFQFFKTIAPGELSVVSGVEKRSRSEHGNLLSEKLVFMDPKSIVRMIDLVQLLSGAQTGKLIVIPKPQNKTGPANYTADAIDFYEKFRKEHTSLKINFGIDYEVYEYHLGQVVFFNPEVFWRDETAAKSEGLHRFFKAVLGLAEVEPVCRLSDSRLQIVSYDSAEDASERLLFILNPTGQKIDTCVSFESLVGLAGVPTMNAKGVYKESDLIFGKSFELSVPAFGVLSMQIKSPSQSQLAEFETQSQQNKQNQANPNTGVQKWI